MKPKRQTNQAYQFLTRRCGLTPGEAMLLLIRVEQMARELPKSINRATGTRQVKEMPK